VDELHKMNIGRKSIGRAQGTQKKKKKKKKCVQPHGDNKQKKTTIKSSYTRELSKKKKDKNFTEIKSFNIKFSNTCNPKKGWKTFGREKSSTRHRVRQKEEGGR